MKKIYVLLLLFILGKTVQAQQYYPLLDSVNTWSYTTHFIGVRLPPSTLSGPCMYYSQGYYGSTFKQYTVADTLIDSLSYKVVMNNYQACLMGFIREDTAARKVFFIDNVSTSERLLYNFSMQVGDTMTLNFPSPSQGYASGVYTLDSITMVQIHAGMRRAFHLNCHTAPGSPVMTWVESVGNLNDMLYPYFDNEYSYGLFGSCPGVQHRFYQFMICFDHLSKVYFDNCSYNIIQNDPNVGTFTDSCDYFSFSGGVREYNAFASMDVYPNPSQGKTNVSLDIKQAADFQICAWNISGEKILKTIPLGKLTQGKKEMELDLSSLPDGFYFLELKAETGSVYQKIIIQH